MSTDLQSIRTRAQVLMYCAYQPRVTRLTIGTIEGTHNNNSTTETPSRNSLEGQVVVVLIFPFHAVGVGIQAILWRGEISDEFREVIHQHRL